MNKKFIDAFIQNKPINYVRFYDLTDGETKERGSIGGALSEFMLSDLATEAENALIVIEEFKIRGEEWKKHI